jgi:ElaB/YqjD/DUF883 family membrane-anchored ribosome-binding protein
MWSKTSSSPSRTKTDKLLKDIRNLAQELRSVTLDEAISGFAEDTKESAYELRGKAGDLLKQEWEQWLTDVGADECPIDPSHGTRVMEDYFAGKPPFKAVKNRNDIPDGFILQTIVDLAKRYQPLHVVANDGAMRAAAAGINGVIAHDKLAAFIDTQECRAALEALAEEAVAENVQRAGSLLSRAMRQLKDAVGSEITTELDGKTVTDASIPDDNNEGMIYMMNDPNEVRFDFEKVEYYGDSEIGVPFEAITECTLNYAIYKADYYVLDEEKQAQISIGERNDHYYDADEDYPIKATGTLQIKLDAEKLRNEEITDDEIVELFDDAEYTVTVDELEVA